MDEEELEQPKKKKITLSNFFESIVKIDKLANRALSTANSNLNFIQDQKLLIDSLSMSIEGLKSDIQEINNYIIVEKKIEKDAEADLRLEEEDKEQKQMMTERLKGDKGEDGDQGEGGDQGDQGDTGKPAPQPVESKGFLGSALGALAPLLGGAGLQLLAPILGGAFTGLKTGGPIGAAIGAPLGGALKFSGLGKSLTGDSTKPNLGESPSPKTNLFETINPFARLGGMFGRKFGKKDEGVEGEKNQVKEEIKSEIKQELNLTTKREKGDSKVEEEKPKNDGFIKDSDLSYEDRRRVQEIRVEMETLENEGKFGSKEWHKLDDEDTAIYSKYENKEKIEPEKKKGRGILGMIGGGIDALTGNLTDLDKRGGKTFGSTRVATGMADFFTADMFDLDKRGKMDLFGMRKKMKNKRSKEAYENNPVIQQYRKKRSDLKEKASKIPMETTINPDGSITSKGSGILIGGELYKSGEKMSLKQRLSIQARIQMQGEDTVEPEMLKDFYDSGGPLSKEESAEYMKSENIEAGVFSPISDEDLKREQDLDKEGNIFSRIGNTLGDMKRLYNEDRKTPELKLSGEAERLIGDDKPFLDEVQKVSEKYEINPADLVGLMASESSLNPAADNGTHVGLIQFSADRAKELGTTQEELVKMSRVQQMKFVEKYFDIVKLPKGASKGELYTSVFMPEYTDKGTDFELSTKFDKFSDGESGNPSVYADNKGLDADDDGFVTVGEMGSRITKKQEEFGISSEKESKPEGIMRILTGIADRVTGEKFDFDKRGDLIPKLENDTAELSGNVLAPPDDSYPKLSAGVIQTLNQTALSQNPSPLVQSEAPQVSEAEIKSTETTSSFIKTISNKTIIKKPKSGLPPEIARMIT